ncbi:MAG: hypothetical protein J6J31_11375 [Thermoguttaceae bacterium]|nr:hypothetical protein [Thermoguttaceae bacterium]
MKNMNLALADPGPVLEYAQADASARLDRENAILHGVKILGFVSLNGRRYTEEALERAKVLYENAKVNVNHPKHSPQAPRDYQDRIGNIRNVCFRKNEGLYADFHFNPRHPLAEQLMWDAEHAPENVGFSHNILARTIPQKDGTLLVEEISLVRSVDLVADPATTQGLFESQETASTETFEGKETFGNRQENLPETSLGSMFPPASDLLSEENREEMWSEDPVSAQSPFAENTERPENSDVPENVSGSADSRNDPSLTAFAESAADGSILLEALQTEIESLQEEIGNLRRQFREMLRLSRKISSPVCRAPQTVFRESGLSMAEFVNRLKSDSRIY